MRPKKGLRGDKIAKKLWYSKFRTPFWDPKIDQKSKKGGTENHQKNDTSKNLFLGGYFRQFGQSDEKNVKNDVHLGSFLGSFLEFFPG